MSFKEITDKEIAEGKAALLSGWGEMGDLIMARGNI